MDNTPLHRVCRRADVDKMLDAMFINVFRPAGGGKQQGAQVKDALGSLTGLFHAAAAEPRFDKGFTGGFGHAAANRHGHGLGGPARAGLIDMTLHHDSPPGGFVNLADFAFGGPVVSILHEKLCLASSKRGNTSRIAARPTALLTASMS